VSAPRRRSGPAANDETATKTHRQVKSEANGTASNSGEREGGQQAGKAGDESRPSQGDGTTSDETGSAGSDGLAGSIEGGTATGHELDEVREWLGRFVCTTGDADLDLLTLWAAHTHLCMETYTTPRLILDSPVPGSGKTTVLEHLERLCLSPVQVASLSSPALLTRMLDAGLRTVLIDEADRSLNPNKDGVAELLAVLNSGYKRGGTRPVLVSAGDGAWKVAEMQTFCPVAMAGNNPNLPEDTKSRSIRVLLMPDIHGTAEESDWELIDEEARELGEQLAEWAEKVRVPIRTARPPLPDGVKGRARERWSPLKRVATMAGGRWPGVVDAMASKDLERIKIEQEDDIVVQQPHVLLLTHLHEVWPKGRAFVHFVSTEGLIDPLVKKHPEIWSEESSYRRRLTAQRMGRMLVTSYNIHSDRQPNPDEPEKKIRGYRRSTLAPAFGQFGMDPPKQTGQTGPTGPTGPKKKIIPAGPTREVLSEEGSTEDADPKEK